jgi:hypothetical protein
MVSTSPVSSVGKRVASRRAAQPLRRVATTASNASVILDEARRAGLLDGEKTEHVSFRAPKALIDAARRESGATKLTELGILALAMLAQPDPAASFLKETRGKLGADHKLDY